MLNFEVGQRYRLWDGTKVIITMLAPIGYPDDVQCRNLNSHNQPTTGLPIRAAKNSTMWHNAKLMRSAPKRCTKQLHNGFDDLFKGGD